MLNVKSSALQLNKLKSETKNATYVTIWLLSNMIGDGATNFPLRLLLTDK